MNRHQCLNKIFKMNHDLDIECTAIYILDHYTEYNKELVYVASILASKLHKRGNFNLQKAGFKLSKNLYTLEKEIVIKLNYQLYHKDFISQVGSITTRKLGTDFLIISRYLHWCNIKASFDTILLAIQIMKKDILKFSKVYNVFLTASKKYDIDMKDLIKEYNDLIKK